MGTDDLHKKKKAQKNGGLKKRSENTRHIKQTFLIVCEGSRTEPNYFKEFKLATATVTPFGSGKNTVSLVQESIVLKKEAIKNKQPYDQIWCVFDRDSFPRDNFDRAIQLADQNGIKVAYTNEAFELWYLLHFDKIDTALSRSQYEGMLTKRLGRKYKKNDNTMYAQLEHGQKKAIDRAKKLLESYPRHDPYKDNPCTTVHQLVEELLKYK